MLRLVETPFQALRNAVSTMFRYRFDLKKVTWSKRGTTGPYKKYRVCIMNNKKMIVFPPNLVSCCYALPPFRFFDFFLKDVYLFKQSLTFWLRLVNRKIMMLWALLKAIKNQLSASLSSAPKPKCTCSTAEPPLLHYDDSMSTTHRKKLIGS